MNLDSNLQRNSQVPIFILAGGLGTRISEETLVKPKPMIEIGGYPMITHIMRYYYSFGFNDFVICAGYLSKIIKDYFKNYELHYNHLEVDNRNLTHGNHEITPTPTTFSNRRRALEQWRVRVLDTGLATMTGARLIRALDIIENRDLCEISTFGVTYGDGLTDCDLNLELDFHYKHKKIATVLGVKPQARFGELDPRSDGLVSGFLEKPESKQGFISGGYFFFENSFRRYLTTEASCVLEQSPLKQLTQDKELYMYEHNGFWSCMDTLRDKVYLQELWDSKNCTWKREG